MKTEQAVVFAKIGLALMAGEARERLDAAFDKDIRQIVGRSLSTTELQQILAGQRLGMNSAVERNQIYQPHPYSSHLFGLSVGQSFGHNFGQPSL
jgi:hypothetical protein